MHKDCVAFSSYVPNVQSVEKATFFLDCFVENFSDCDIYVGVNYPWCSEWVETLEAYKEKLNLFIDFVDINKVIDSDAAGYQNALNILKHQGSKYRTVLFAHTKGVTHSGEPAKLQRDMEGLKSVFFTKEVRQRVDSIFMENPKIGLFSDYCTKSTDQTIESLDKLFNFYFSGNKIMILASIYYIRGSLVHQFIHNCDKKFFTENLLSLGYDRYFFERDFPTIVTRFGYEMKTDNYTSHPQWYHFDKKNFDDIVSMWRKENNL